MIDDIKVSVNDIYNLKHPSDELKDPKETNILDVIYLDKNGKYLSMDDSTWFEEELEKNDKITYDKDLDVYTVVGPRGFNWAHPGNLILRFYEKYFVMDKAFMLLFIVICYGSCFMDEEKNEKHEVRGE